MIVEWRMAMRRIFQITGIWFWVSIVLSGLLLAQRCVSYKFPIKPDPFGHSYRTHMGDRMIAYAYLLKSGDKFSRWDSEEINAIIEALPNNTAWLLN